MTAATLVVLFAADLAVVAVQETRKAHRASEEKRKLAIRELAESAPNRKYRPGGNYVGPVNAIINPFPIVYGADGFPRIVYPGVGSQINPSAIAEYGLSAFDRRDYNATKRAADALLRLQSRDGRWLYHFNFSGGPQKIQAPWASAFAQGQAMSLLERTYRLTHQRFYLDAAVRALRPLTIPVNRGGMHRCFNNDCRFPWYEEYPTPRPTYVLNGFMFTLIGLYDVASVAPKSGAIDLYRAGRRTLLAKLPLYDMGSRGGSYSLVSGHRQHAASWHYQAIQVYMLRTLASIEPSPEFTETANRWESLLRDQSLP